MPIFWTKERETATATERLAGLSDLLKNATPRLDWRFPEYDRNKLRIPPKEALRLRVEAFARRTA